MKHSILALAFLLSASPLALWGRADPRAVVAAGALRVQAGEGGGSGCSGGGHSALLGGDGSGCGGGAALLRGDGGGASCGGG